MPRVVPLACVLALLAPAAAAGQTTPGDLGEAPPLVPRPPVAPAPEREPGGRDDDPAARAPAETGELPDTGADARTLALLGAGLLLSGVGLRLRTTDERF